MSSARGRLYPLLLFLSASGYVWLFVSNDGSRGIGWSGCITKFLFHIPCPACGTTRAVRAVFHGEWWDSLYYNPFGLLVAVAMVVVPIWIIADLFTGSASFLKAYHWVEGKLREWPYALTGIALILINWIWNLTKYT